MKTYCFASNTELFVVPAKDGRTDLDALKEALGDDAACFYLQQPNYFGQIEDAKAAGEIVHAAGAKFVMGVNPIACAILPTPRAMARMSPSATVSPSASTRRSAARSSASWPRHPP